MIPAQQLLNDHLDNIAIRLRNAKPFTPNDFPAVQLYENIIKDAPIEHGFAFDSTGMPSNYLQGEPNTVDIKPWDVDVNNMSKRDDTMFWQYFHAPVSLISHNHPSSSLNDKIYGNSPLSKPDLMYAANYEVPIRATNADGKVYEYTPGYSTPETIEKVVDQTPGILRVPKVLGNVLQTRQHYNFLGDAVPKDPNNLPQYNIYQNSPTPLPIPEMMTDSFNIRRQAKIQPQPQTQVQPRQAVFQQLGDGTYQSLIDGKPYKVLTQGETDAAIDKMRNDTKWQMTVRSYQGPAGF